MRRPPRLYLLRPTVSEFFYYTTYHHLSDTLTFQVKHSRVPLARNDCCLTAGRNHDYNHSLTSTFSIPNSTQPCHSWSIRPASRLRRLAFISLASNSVYIFTQYQYHGLHEPAPDGSPSRGEMGLHCKHQAYRIFQTAATDTML